MFVEIVIFLGLLLYAFHWHFTKQRRRLSAIPGPQGSYLFGNVFQINQKAPFLTVHEWSREYGPVYQFRTGNTHTVMVSSYEGIVEMLNSEDCSSRMHYYRIHDIMLDWVRNIVGHPYSEGFLEKKKLLSRSLNAYGTGRTKIEALTLQHVDILIDNLKEQSKDFTRAINAGPLFFECVAGIIMTLTYGKTLEAEEMMQLLHLVKGQLAWCSPTGINSLIDFLHICRYLPLKDIQEPQQHAIDFREWFVKRFDEEVGEESILASLNTYTNKVTGKRLEKGDIIGMTLDLVGAGFLTTTTTMNCLIVILINYPEVQAKIYHEIEEIGKSRPMLSDKARMPYTNAVLEELLRFSSIVPHSVPHYTIRDTTIQGKMVAKDTLIMPDFWTLHHDPQYFPDPWIFKPERYLDDSGQLLPVSAPVRKHTLAFSAGRRVCAGEGLARSRLFLLITSLLACYRFLPEDINNVPSCDPRDFEGHIAVGPCPYRVKIEPR